MGHYYNYYYILFFYIISNVFLRTTISQTINYNAPSPSSGDFINCSNWTALYWYLNPNCTAPSPSFIEKEEMNATCTLYFRWNTSYSAFDDEKYVGQYTCIGCNNAFVKHILLGVSRYEYRYLSEN